MCRRQDPGASPRPHPAIFPMLPGVPQRQSHDYIGNGTIDSYAALNLATGEVSHHLTVQHRVIELKKFLVLIDKSVPAVVNSPKVSSQVASIPTPINHCLCFVPASLPSSRKATRVHGHERRLVCPPERARIDREAVCSPCGHPFDRRGLQATEQLPARNRRRRSETRRDQSPHLGPQALQRRASKARSRFRASSLSAGHLQESSRWRTRPRTPPTAEDTRTCNFRRT